MRGVNLLLDNGLKVELKTVAMRSNYHEIEKMAYFCREMTGAPLVCEPFLHMRLDGNNQRNEDIMSERLSPDEIVALGRFDPSLLRIREKGCNKIIDPAQKDDNLIFWCGVGGRSFMVDSECCFHPCPSLSRQDCIYDLRSGSLTDAWYSFRPIVKDLKHSKEPQLGCKKCSIRSLCISCPAHAYAENGDLESKVEYFCEVAHERARSNGLI
jgi:radical SAM protein with 4Fe4S-binding SPASM domain